ncbi:MAG TPA: TIGR03618 family F420-dependent PPOX class oxidoreductase [Candidatus Eisenbacteria bacterium]|nr:TIGR03618 family F420-dependent PPOX class oxidoreductase [Candidatus Eisenbacteria bacterium]
MNRRDQIALTPDEQRSYLDSAHTIILATNGPKGHPQLTAMWFIPERDGTILMTTFAKSQKTKNLERDPRCTLLVESGRTYPELKGLMITGRADLVRDTEKVLDMLERVNVKYNGLEPSVSLRDALRGQASKRVLVRITPIKTSSWDHSKLGAGVY